MENLTINEPAEGDDGREESKALKFSESFNDPSANVILTSADGIRFRVHDFFLKAASPVFLDMLSLPTKGGQIKLVETAAAIRMVLADVTHSEQSRDEPELAVLTSAFGLAKRFDMKGSMAQITIRLCDHNDGPALLVWACDQVPIDRLVSRCALVAFTNEAYFEMLLKLPWCSERASCHPRNLERTKLEALSKDGYIAYSRAWGDCAQQTGNSIEFVDWGDMANAFINNLKQMRK